MPTNASKGDKVILTIRPQDINTHVSKPDDSGNLVEGKIKDIAFGGDIDNCHVVVNDKVINVRLLHKTLLQEGETVFLELPSDSIVVIPRN
ncbi:TOBE domain-containing protein [Thermodesulfobacteriota bacterium]